MFGFNKTLSNEELKKHCEANTDAWASTYNELVKLGRELKGTQETLYSLINNLNKGLKLDKKGKPIVINKKGKK